MTGRTDLDTTPVRPFFLSLSLYILADPSLSRQTATAMLSLYVKSYLCILEI